MAYGDAIEDMRGSCVRYVCVCISVQDLLVVSRPDDDGITNAARQALKNVKEFGEPHRKQCHVNTG